MSIRPSQRVVSSHLSNLCFESSVNHFGSAHFPHILMTEKQLLRKLFSQQFIHKMWESERISETRHKTRQDKTLTETTEKSKNRTNASSRHVQKKKTLSKRATLSRFVSSCSKACFASQVAQIFKLTHTSTHVTSSIIFYKFHT